MTYAPRHDRFEYLAATSVSVVVTDAQLPDNPIIYANGAFSDLTGYAPAEILNRNCRFLRGPDTDPLVSAEIGAAIAAGTTIRRDILNYRKDGTPFWNDVAIDPIYDEAGLLTGFIGIQRPADATYLAKRDKEEAESRLALIASNVSGYIYQRVMRPDGSIEVTYLSASLRTMLGIAEDEDFNFYDYVHPDDRPLLVAAVRSSAANMSIFREEFRLVSRDGSVHWLRSDAPPRRMPNGDIVWDGLAIEIAAETRWASEIANQALRDPLTGLLTRSAGRRLLAAGLDVSSAHDGPTGLIHLDIAEFRALNDRLGPSAGDQVLSETAQRLARIAGSVDGIAARLGGDEFMILLPECPDQQRVEAVIHALGDALAPPMRIGGQDVAVRACIGAALLSRRDGGGLVGEDLANELMTQAELALRWSKEHGHCAPAVYSTAMDDRFRDQTILAQSLDQAIANGELELHYQPLVHLVSGRIVAAEALVRWHHPTLGMQRPDRFIRLAEQSGSIVPLGSWVIEQAFRQHRAWQEAGANPPPIAINVSGIQLLDPGFVARVADALRTTGARAADFEFELTEGLLIEPSAEISVALHALREMGFALTIDDFGSGHATFRYLRDFPIDKFKLDQIFVRKLVVESTDALIIKAVISLAHSMRVGFVAEGIETEMQRDFLIREGCQIGQGYLFSMPLMAEDLGWMLANDIRLPQRATMQPAANEADQAPRSTEARP